jgi:hypothetical protein
MAAAYVEGKQHGCYNQCVSSALQLLGSMIPSARETEAALSSELVHSGFENVAR